MLLVGIWLVFRRTRLATSIVAIGSSEGAAFMSGLNVIRAKILAYTISGTAAGAAGFYLTAQTGNGNALSGQTYMLNTIAAVVLGGANLAGGAGTYLGTVAGAYIIALIRGCSSSDVSQFCQELPRLVLLAAVGLGAIGVLRARNRLDKVWRCHSPRSKPAMRIGVLHRPESGEGESWVESDGLIAAGLIVLLLIISGIAS